MPENLNPPRSPLVRGEDCSADSVGEVPTTPSPDKGRAGEGLGRAGDEVNSRGTYLPYNKNLRELARENRRNPTPAESKIWNDLLRNKQFAKHKFTRQKPLGSYIVDFYSSALKLVIEIDGESHANQLEYDCVRTQYLHSLGVRVIRFTNQEVMHNLEGVFIHLTEYIE